MNRAVEKAIYYEAMLSRDPRFDGVFFAGVTSTGIYCRPICPAPKPRQENVDFYATSAGAEENGFRPCKRCRPDAAPGTPVWAGPSATVSQALQFINNGYLDEHNVEQLGALLGLGGRQLRRLFKTHLGAPPIAVALTRRLDFARKLIDETGLSMTDIAFSSGFESIRRFNDAVKKRFGESPSDLRKAIKTTKQGNGQPAGLRLHLPYRPPLAWAELSGYLAGRRIQGVEVIDETGYSRSFAIGKHQGVLRVTASDSTPELVLEIHMEETAHLMAIVRRVRRMFDLEADPMFITGHFQNDPLLSTVVRAFPGLRVPGGFDNFELAIRTIIGQQVSIAAANTIMARLLERCGTVLPDSFDVNGGITHLFPTPEILASADLSGLGIPGKRIETIGLLSRKVAEGEIDVEGGSGIETLKGALLEIPGIGKWTTEYLGMRAFRQPDAFPASDLALKRQLENGEPPDSWRPWRSYAAIYLWKRYSTL
jgi:AraC family transcriptional regulator of adaptative response / DNA-3-methyladenine glycosylase II